MTGSPRRLVVVSIGAGDPDLLTFQAARALAETDVVFVLDKGPAYEDLEALRSEVLRRHAKPGVEIVTVPDPPRHLRDDGYEASVAEWHGARTELLATTMADRLGPGGVGAFLAWGDASLYDSTLRLLDELRVHLPWPFEIEVVPGVSSLHLLTARQRIPLNRVGAEVRLTTGRRLLDAPPGPSCDVVVFLDSSCRFTELDPTNLDIVWGAYLGTPDEILVAGALDEVGGEIVERRAAARERKGWMFDTYLLRWRG